MNKQSIVSLALLACALALPAAAQQGQVMAGSAPGAAGVAQTMNISATITKIDTKTREVTLKGPQGGEMTVVAGPEVKNFDRLKAGDKVNLKYLEALMVELKKGGGLPVERSEKAAAGSAKPGETPGAAAGRQITVVGDVIATDPATQMVTVRGPQRTVNIHVRDPEQFKLIAKGDQLQATYTEAVAIDVTPL